MSKFLIDFTPFCAQVNTILTSPNGELRAWRISALETELKAYKMHILHEKIEGWVEIKLGVIGNFEFPLRMRGTVSTLDLFTVSDLILFWNYSQTKLGNQIFIDIGANVGLHAAVAHLSGFKVIAFEPDPESFSLGQQFLSRLSNDFLFFPKNSVSPNMVCPSNSCIIEAAVSDEFSSEIFIRLLNNPFGNHLKGSKQNVYGPVRENTVKTVDIKKFLRNVNSIKIDAEGADAMILNAILEYQRSNDWSGKIYLCDWRDETRTEIFNAVASLTAFVESGESGEKLSCLEQAPKNNSSDFVIVKI